MSKRVIILLLTMMVVGNSMAQSLGNNVSYFDGEVRQQVEVEGYGGYGSNVMDIETMRLFYRGGYFDDDLKSESLNRLVGKNLLGAEYGGSATYVNPSVKWLDSAGYYITYGLSGGGGVSFTKDLFKLVFEGNQSYVGDSAILSGTEFSSFAYKKIGFGYVKVKKDGIHRMGISLMAFDSYSYGVLDRGIYSSDVDSDTLQLMMSGNWMTDSRVGNESPIGYGVGLDYEAKLFPVNSDSSSVPMLVCGVKNLGVFFSSKQMNVLSLDTVYSYSGVEMNDISGFGSELFPQTLDGDSLLPDFEQKRQFRLLPFELYFYSPSNPNGKKMQLVYGMRYRYGVAMIPQIYIGGDWRPNETTIITPFMQFGGYSYFKTGLSIRKQIGDFGIGLAFNNVPGFMTREAYQQSLAITMSYGIK